MKPTHRDRICARGKLLRQECFQSIWINVSIFDDLLYRRIATISGHLVRVHEAYIKYVFGIEREGTDVLRRGAQSPLCRRKSIMLLLLV